MCRATALWIPEYRSKMSILDMLALRKIYGQESWVLETAEIEAAVTRQAGHLAPVRFRLGNRKVEPYAIAPWTGENLGPGMPEVLRVMRGDFFCMPFGGNETPFRGENHPPHGVTANAEWTFEEGSLHRLHLSMNSSIRKGRVDKLIEILPGQSAIYSRHTISGMEGPMCFGHHPILRIAEGSVGRVSTSPFRFGQVAPEPFEDPAHGGYFSLKPGGRFTSLSQVPCVNAQWTDLSVYPSREGYEDLVMMVSATSNLPFAWTALVIPEENYVWLSLKDPAVLKSTVIWMSNGGRHYAPWNGRHRRTIGLEEVTSYFHYGLAESAGSNPLRATGIETQVELKADSTLTINYIMAVAEIPPGFDIVKSIDASPDSQSVILTSESGEVVTTQVNLPFIAGQ